eukprot:5019983-Karenia_brevis.AAC.1
MLEITHLEVLDTQRWLLRWSCLNSEGLPPTLGRCEAGPQHVQNVQHHTPVVRACQDHRGLATMHQTGQA